MTYYDFMKEKFSAINRTLLFLRSKDNDLIQKYGGSIVLSNITPLPQNLDRRQLAENLTADGINTFIDSEGFIHLQYRSKEEEKNAKTEPVL